MIIIIIVAGHPPSNVLFQSRPVHAVAARRLPGAPGWEGATGDCAQTTL